MLSYASGFIIGSNDIFSQVDIILCMWETITACGFVFVFIEWNENDLIMWRFLELFMFFSIRLDTE